MMVGVTSYALYQELAGWWPLISPAAEYAEDAEMVTAVFGSAAGPVRSVLDLGSGGGHVALHLKAGRSMTLVDLSAQMLATSRESFPSAELRSLVSPVSGCDCSKKNCAEALDISSRSVSSLAVSGRGAAGTTVSGAEVGDCMAPSNAGARASEPPKPAAWSRNWRRLPRNGDAL